MRLEALAAVGLSAMLTCAVAAPAQAAGGLEFSLDGEIWLSDLERPLFSEADKLVPGDQVSRSFWIRNGSTFDADLVVSVMSPDFSSIVDEEGLWVEASVENDLPERVEPTSRAIVHVPNMPGTSSKKVTVTVGMDDAAGDSTQLRSFVPAQLRVQLTESLDPTVRSQDDDSARESLAETGASILWLAGSGVALLVGGGLAVASARSKNPKFGGSGHGNSQA